MSAPQYVPVTAEELLEGWRVVIGHLGSSDPAPGTVERRQGELVLVSAMRGVVWPLSVLEGHVLYRVLAPLPEELGYYQTKDPDHELIERTATGWRSTAAAGAPLSDAQVREMGGLEHYVKAWLLRDARLAAARYGEEAAAIHAQLAATLGELASARAEVAPAHAAGRAEVLAELWSFLRARGLWWRPVRRAVAQHFGASLTAGGRHE